MKANIAVSQTFWIIVFFISIVAFISGVLWLREYGLDIIHMLPGLAGCLRMPKKSTGQKKKSLKKKGLSVTLNAVWFIVAVVFILMMLMVSSKIGFLSLA